MVTVKLAVKTITFLSFESLYPSSSQTSYQIRAVSMPRVEDELTRNHKSSSHTQRSLT